MLNFSNNKEMRTAITFHLSDWHRLKTNNLAFISVVLGPVGLGTTIQEGHMTK